MSDTKTRLALASATITAYTLGDPEHPLAKVAKDLDLCAARAEPEQRDGDPRVDALGNNAILTDTKIRVTFAPERPEARVVALEKEVPATRLAQLAAMMQQGAVHIQFKAGFAPERKLVLVPAEMALLYDLLDRFIHELPRVDNKTA